MTFETYHRVALILGGAFIPMVIVWPPVGFAMSLAFCLWLIFGSLAIEDD